MAVPPNPEKRATARHFRVVGTLDGAGGVRRGKVTITPDGFFQVRPFRRRRVFELPLSAVADMVCKRTILAEVKVKRADKKRKRQGHQR